MQDSAEIGFGGGLLSNLPHCLGLQGGPGVQVGHLPKLPYSADLGSPAVRYPLDVFLAPDGSCTLLESPKFCKFLLLQILCPPSQPP